MDTLTEDFGQPDVDSEMQMLTPDDVAEQNLDTSDDVEVLRNSLREAVHDDSVRPKMQCLMMDSSFSMVTMQGEDSGIAWETTPNRCATPWASEPGIPTADQGSAVRPATPGSQPAGRIIFVMDEEMMSRRKKAKESGQKSKAERQREALAGSFDNISGRPELVGFSQPNVKNEDGGNGDEPTDHLLDKEQRLFSLVSDGSEILNIVVPPKLATVDEEESKEMVDNLAYLEESPVPKATKQTPDLKSDPMVLTNTPTGLDGQGGDQVNPRFPVDPNVMDPPGAPVAKPPGRGAASSVDYFEAFTLIDAQAPGGPAVTASGPADPQTEGAAESQYTENPVLSQDTTITKTVNNDKLDTISLEEITSELLDEVFYSGTDVESPLDREEGHGVAQLSLLPSKPCGSTLFGSQEDILTPIFLPEGPPKIIDPILLEEPKAMAFHYTDLYEEAIGSRKKEEDTESMTSEKSFHSRNSDREARGYLEKYVLIDETPVVEVQEMDKCPGEGPRVMAQDLYYMGDFASKPEKGEMPHSEEITDFFRSSANSSPCDIEPFPRTQDEDEGQKITKSKAKTNKTVSIKLEKEVTLPEVEDSPEEPDWGGIDDHDIPLEESDTGVHTIQETWKQDLEMSKPVAPPRKKAATSLKECLNLTPLIPVDNVTQENEEASLKEQREEEKESASPAETANEGDEEKTTQGGDGEEKTQGGDGGEAIQVSCNLSLLENALTEPAQTESVDGSETTVEDTKPAAAEGKDTETAEIREKTAPEAVPTQTEADFDSSEFVKAEVCPEDQGDSSTIPPEPDKGKGQCVIL